jgi:hypothetical protein
MNLVFGSIEIDTKGLPRPLVVNVGRPYTEGGPVWVHIALEDGKRSAVEKWAARLGVEVVESVRPIYTGDPMPLHIAAEVEADGYRVTVYIRTALAPPSAEPQSTSIPGASHGNEKGLER